MSWRRAIRLIVAVFIWWKLSGNAFAEELPDRLTTGESIQIAGLQLFMNLWILFFGASVGSFLNVIVYRMPREMSLSSPPSRCPGCETKIRRGDNLPVIGWLLLKGRCRACQMRIPIRYPTVEAITGLLFLLVAHLELLSGGATLPVRVPEAYTGFIWVVWYTKWDLVSLYLYHMLMIINVLTIGLMSRDGVRIPLRLWGPLIAVGIVCPMIWPGLHPQPWSMSLWHRAMERGESPDWWWGMASCLLGGGVGLSLGWGGGKLLDRDPKDGIGRQGLKIGLLIVGIYLGWQAGLWVGLLVYASSSVWNLMSRKREGKGGDVGITLVGSTVGFLITWRWWPVILA